MASVLPREIEDGKKFTIITATVSLYGVTVRQASGLITTIIMVTDHNVIASIVVESGTLLMGVPIATETGKAEGSGWIMKTIMT